MPSVFSESDLANLESVLSVEDVLIKYPSVVACYLSEVVEPVIKCPKYTGIDNLSIEWSGPNSDTLNSIWILERSDLTDDDSEDDVYADPNSLITYRSDLDITNRVLTVDPDYLGNANEVLLIGTHTLTATFTSLP